MTFEHSIQIGAAAASLFGLTQDYRRRLEWDPFLRAADLLGGAQEAGLGVRARCVAWYGSAMETEYVSFDPPSTTAVKMTRGPRLIRQFAGTWHFHEESPGQTRVSFRYHLRARPAWLTAVVAWFFARDTRKRLQALKAFVERPVANVGRSGG